MLILALGIILLLGPHVLTTFRETRTGLIELLRRMGADIRVHPRAGSERAATCALESASAEAIALRTLAAYC